MYLYCKAQLNKYQLFPEYRLNIVKRVLTMSNMNRLPTETRAQILHLLVEGNSVNATARLVGVQARTVLKLLVDAGDACMEHHERTVRNIRSRYVQIDEMWSFCYAKQENRDRVRASIDWAGDVYVWVGIDTDTKLIVSWYAGNRDSAAGGRFMHDLAQRLDNAQMLSTDGYAVYPGLIGDAFGREQEHYTFMPDTRRDLNEAGINNVYVERQNLTMRMSNRRLIRQTNGYSKKMRNHVAMLALYFTYYNFCREHITIGTTPAVEAGLDEYPRDTRWIVRMVNARAPIPRRGPYRPHTRPNRRRAQVI